MGGNVHLSTWQENSTVNLSASGDLSVLAPAWTQELTADNFGRVCRWSYQWPCKFYTDHRPGNSSCHGSRDPARGLMPTNGNNGLGDLRDALQAAIEATEFTKIDKNSGETIGGGQYLSGDEDATSNYFKVRLNDGRFMFTSQYAFTMDAGGTGQCSSAWLYRFPACRGRRLRSRLCSRCSQEWFSC